MPVTVDNKRPVLSRSQMAMSSMASRRGSSEWSACLKRANERHRGLGLIRRRRAPTEAALFRLACARFSGSSFKFCPKDALLSFELLRRQHGFLMANEAYLFGVLTPKAKRRCMAGLRMSRHH